MFYWYSLQLSVRCTRILPPPNKWSTTTGPHWLSTGGASTYTPATHRASLLEFPWQSSLWQLCLSLSNPCIVMFFPISMLHCANDRLFFLSLLLLFCIYFLEVFFFTSSVIGYDISNPIYCILYNLICNVFSIILEERKLYVLSQNQRCSNLVNAHLTSVVNLI